MERHTRVEHRCMWGSCTGLHQQVFNSASHDRLLFLVTVSHSLDAHIPSLHDSSSSADSDNDDDDDAVPQPPFPHWRCSHSSHCSVHIVVTWSGRVADCCEVCLQMPRSGVALEPCGHSCFCSTCADTVAAIGTAVLCAAHVLIWYNASTTDWTVSDTATRI